MIQYDPHRWFDHFFDIRGSMVREIIGRVAACVVWAAVVVAFHRYVQPVAIPLSVHTLTGFALGLLLVFRTNSSYERFWEGRKLWGGIVNETRNLARLALAHLGEAAAPVVRWTIALPYAAMLHLRGDAGAGPVAERLGPEAQDLAAAPHRPLYVARRLTELLAAAAREGRISDVVLRALDDNVQQLVDYVGACERIRSTPLPFAYVVHLRRALILYCYSLPFALVEQFGWGAVLDVFVITYVFFGIEEIGVEIEGPFGDDANDLPLEEICAKIDGDLTALLAGRGR
jgi:putative membrane protein